MTKLEHIPPHLRIRIILRDESIVVIDKPPNLRSVKGLSGRKRPREEGSRLTASEAWTKALQVAMPSEKDPIENCLARLNQKDSRLASIPRKRKLFQRYIERNRQRLFSDDNEKCDETTVEAMYQRLRERHVAYMNLPELTAEEESAEGQVSILEGQGTTVRVVHRLDMETSGVMVFARTASAASALARMWREREAVQKTYWADVYDWPVSEEDSGRIDLALSPGEGVRWQVCETGKASTTLWKKEGTVDNVTRLVLTPVTGRTHQLRVHCAAVAGGIVGDSLYGRDAKAEQGSQMRLRLHAYRLSFLHPESHEPMEFVAEPNW